MWDLRDTFRFPKQDKKRMTKITLLVRIIQLLTAEKFKKMADAFESNTYSKGIDSWLQLVTLLFTNYNIH